MNEEKTDWQPRQIGQWLGFIVDTIRMTFQVPPKKLEKLKRVISDVLNSPTVSLRNIARIAGYLVSMTMALGPIGRLFTRQMYYVIAWQDVVTISEPVAQEVKFWLNHVDAFNGYAIKRKFSATAIVLAMRVTRVSVDTPLLWGIIRVWVTGANLKQPKVPHLESLRQYSLYCNHLLRFWLIIK